MLMGVDKASVLAELARVMARQDGRRALSERLCAAAATIAGARGASLTIAYTSPHRVTLCSTDDVSARLEDLQDVLGQGPGPSAYVTGSQVRMDIGPGPDEGFDSRWPAFDEAARAAFTSVQVIAVPIHPDSEFLGVLTYHQPRAAELSPQTLGRSSRGALAAMAAARSGLSEELASMRRATGRAHPSGQAHRVAARSRPPKSRDLIRAARCLRGGQQPPSDAHPRAVEPVPGFEGTAGPPVP